MHGSMRRGRRRHRSFFSQRNTGAIALLVLLVLVLTMFYLRALRGNTAAQHMPGSKLSQQAEQKVAQHAQQARQALHDSARYVAQEAQQLGAQQTQQAGQAVNNIVGQATAQLRQVNALGQQLPPGVRAPGVQGDNAQQLQREQLPPNIHAPLRRPDGQQVMT